MLPSTRIDGTLIVLKDTAEKFPSRDRGDSWDLGQPPSVSLECNRGKRGWPQLHCKCEERPVLFQGGLMVKVDSCSLACRILQTTIFFHKPPAWFKGLENCFDGLHMSQGSWTHVETHVEKTRC